MFRVVALMVNDDHEITKYSLNGAPIISALGHEESCDMGGSSKQVKSEAICLCFKGADVRSLGMLFRVVAYMMSQNRNTAQQKLNGPITNAVLSGDETCIVSATQTHGLILPPP
jgi:spore germination protein GerM